MRISFLSHGAAMALAGLALVVLGPAAQAELSHELSGVVRAVTGRPLAGATVSTDDGGRSATTDATGAYRLSVSAGEHTLVVSHAAFRETRRVVAVEGARRGEDFALEPLYRVSEDVVVHAVRADALTPVTRSDIPAEDLARLNHGQEMPFLLQQTPSLTQYADAGLGAGYSYLYLRGIQQTRINMTLDGVPLNEPEDSAVYFSDFGDFASSLDSIQVQRGVGTSTVGAAAYGGSINFASTELKDRREIVGTLGAGSFGSRRASLALQSGRVGPGLAFYGRGSHLETDGFREHSGIVQSSGFAAASRQGGRSFFKLFAFVGVEETQLAFLASEKSVIEANPRANDLSPEERDRFSESFVQAQYTRAIGSASTLSLQGYSVGAGGWYRIFAAGPGSDLYQYGLDWRFSGGMISFRHARGRTSLTLGAHAYDHASRHTRDVVAGSHDYDNRGFKNEANAFAKLSHDLGRWHAYADAQLRWARFRYEGDVPLGSVDWTFFNPKLGLRYDLATGLGLYASLGRTTREPARSDMLSGEDNASVRYELNAVRPESVTDLEVGMSLERSAFTLKADVYAMEFRDEIALTGELSEIGLPLRRNVGRSHRRGLELDLAWRPSPVLRLSAAANLSRNRIAEWTQFYDVYDTEGSWIESVSRAHSDVTPLLTPSAMGHLAVDWHPARRLELGAVGRLVGRTYLDNTDDPALATPRLLQLDASLALNLAGRVPVGEPTLRVKVTNLLNARELFPSGYSYLYFTRADAGQDVPGGTAYYYPLATRAVTVTLDTRF